MTKINETRLLALEAEAAFEACAKAMGGWAELSRWASQNPRHAKEITLRFLPAGFFSQKEGSTLEELVLESRMPLSEYSDEGLLQTIRSQTSHRKDYLDEAQRRGLVAGHEGDR